MCYRETGIARRIPLFKATGAMCRSLHASCDFSSWHRRGDWLQSWLKKRLSSLAPGGRLSSARLLHTQRHRNHSKPPNGRHVCSLLLFWPFLVSGNTCDKKVSIRQKATQFYLVFSRHSNLSTLRPIVQSAKYILPPEYKGIFTLRFAQTWFQHDHRLRTDRYR